MRFLRQLKAAGDCHKEDFVEIIHRQTDIQTDTPDKFCYFLFPVSRIVDKKKHLEELVTNLAIKMNIILLIHLSSEEQ